MKPASFLHAFSASETDSSVKIDIRETDMILDLMTLLFYVLLFFHGKEKEALKQNEKTWLSKACGQCMKG